MHGGKKNLSNFKPLSINKLHKIVIFYLCHRTTASRKNSYFCILNRRFLFIHFFLPKAEAIRKIYKISRASASRRNYNFITIKVATNKEEKVTPLMRQYYAMKQRHPDAVLLFRVGDFYETYGDDAVRSSSILGITLTKRSNGAAADVEMAGFPHHAIDV